jgi:hypothetical protein
LTKTPFSFKHAGEIGVAMKKTGLALILPFLSLLTIGTALAPAAGNTSVSAPAIEWQEDYGHPGPYDDTNVESASNLIQTSDGGYAFMDLGWGYQFTLIPSTIYKVDSSGNLQWTKTIDFLAASKIIQTSDGGYEVTGHWTTYPVYPEYTPTLIKTDPQGNIQWAANYSSLPDLGISSTETKTSDGGIAYWNVGSITKTDSENNTQWVKNLTYTVVDGTAPLKLSSVIETSDGALAVLGVGYHLFDNPRTGRVYLIKTEAFLPLPSQTPLPTPMPTPTPEPISTGLVIAVVILVAIGTIAIIVVIIVGLLRYYKKRCKDKST